jgi:hypothetical protein
MGNWFLMEKLQSQWNSGQQQRQREQRKRQICHLMDMIECSFQRVLSKRERECCRGCETISLIDLIDYNINYNLTAAEVIVDRRSRFVLSPIDIISKIFHLSISRSNDYH